MKQYQGFIKLGCAAALGFLAWLFGATFVGYVPSLLLVFWSFDD